VQSVKEWKNTKCIFGKAGKIPKKHTKIQGVIVVVILYFSVKKQNNYKHVQNNNKINTTAISQKYKIQKHMNPKLQ